ncbi:MAG: hypothetical protein HGB17_07040, partial [Syntrophobacteraceae bacterium]|nr:hypothetical protein [Syntrophobacteraceae bacterium]
ELFSQNAEQKHVTLEHVIATGTLVYADDSMIRTVLRNLVSNALKFTPEGGKVDSSGPGVLAQEQAGDQARKRCLTAHSCSPGCRIAIMVECE